MTTPRRYQLRRGLPRMGIPEGITPARVGRGSRYGNPFDWRTHGHAEAVELFHQHLLGSPALLDAVRRNLRGRDLACWCSLDCPCHADVLLAEANRQPPTTNDRPTPKGLQRLNQVQPPQPSLHRVKSLPIVDGHPSQ